MSNTPSKDPSDNSALPPSEQPIVSEDDRYLGVLVRPLSRPNSVHSSYPEDLDNFYQPLPPSLTDVKRDHAAIKDHLPPKSTVTIDNSPEARQKLITSIMKLLENSSAVEGLGPNGEIIRIERGILTFVEVVISTDNGRKNFGCHGISVPRSVDTEIVTKFQIDEEGIITDASSSLVSAHSSIYSPQIEIQMSPLPLTTDLQSALDAFHLTKQGSPMGLIRKALRTAVVVATEMTPFADGYNDRFRRENPRPPRINPNRDELF